MRSSRTTTSLRRFSLTARMVVGNVNSQMVDWRCRWVEVSSSEFSGEMMAPPTLVLTIWSRRVLEAGRSPAPTKATSEVQNSISTIEVAPSPARVHD